MKTSTSILIGAGIIAAVLSVPQVKEYRAEQARAAAAQEAEREAAERRWQARVEEARKYPRGWKPSWQASPGAD